MAGGVSALPLDVRVVAYFDLPSTPVLTLNDPVKGKLDDATYVLAGDIATDITSTVQAVSVSRGRSRLLDDIQVGSASVTVRNLDRAFDPLHSGTYSTNIVPAKRVTILLGGAAVFDGTVDDWDLSYSLDGDAVASMILSDPLATLGRAAFAGHTFSSELSGDRIEAALDRPEVDFPAGRRDIDDGLTTLAGGTVAEGDNVLDYLRTVARTELGRLFAARDGTITYRERLPPVQVGGLVTFADDATGVPFSSIDVQIGSELLYNRVAVTRVGGSTQIETDADSIADYGTRTLELSDLLFDDDDDAALLAEYLAHTFGVPKVRVASVGLNMARLDATQATQVASLDIGDLVEVVFTPPGGGSAIDRYALVEGIDHSIGLDSHNVTFRLSSLDNAPFRLDCIVCGILDGEAVLAY